MNPEEKTCITCKEKFTIYHLAQRQKKYCSGKCSNGMTKPKKKDILDNDAAKYSGES